MRKFAFMFVLAAAAAGVTQVEATNRAKSIKEVMAEAHKGNPALSAKASKGLASKGDVETLVVLYTDLAAGKPNKGDADFWKKACDTLLTATKGLLKDPSDKGAVKAYAAAVNCAGCHKSFK